MVELEACCRLHAVDFNVLKVPIGSCARAIRKCSCLYFLLGRFVDSFMIRKASMMAVLSRKCKTYFHHFYWAVPQNISSEIDQIGPLPEKRRDNGRHSVDGELKH